MNNGKIKQILLNILLILLAFTVQNCVFPLLPFLAATPNLLLILTFSFGFIHGRNAGMFYGFLSGLLLDLFYSGPFGFYTLIYVYIGYFNGIFTKYYYEDYITLPLILSILNEYKVRNMFKRLKILKLPISNKLKIVTLMYKYHILWILNLEKR